MIDKNYLEHYGILGMKWGIRRKNPSGKGRSSKSTQKDSQDTRIKKKTMAKKIDSMSDKELQNVTKRLQLEKQYKELTKKQVSPGKKFVQELMAETAKSAVKTYVSKYTNKQVEALLKRSA